MAVPVKGTLTARLRAETTPLHTRAERTVFMSALMRGRLDRQAYCLLLRNLEPAYRVMEAGLIRHAAHPHVAPVALPALFRSAALRRDLEDLQGPSWTQEVQPMPSADAWARRLQHIADDSPALLVAHAYVRYLGDLSGGQMLRKVICRSLGLQAHGGGLAFYDFGPADAAGALALALRAGLNEASPTPAGQDAVVAEAIWAFELHCTLFDELAQAAGLQAPDSSPRMASTTPL